MEDSLGRITYGGWTLWCRKTVYRSYKNVCAVQLLRDGDLCSHYVHKVYGVLANGEHFGGFLVRSKKRKHSLAPLSDKYAAFNDESKRGGHWVVVEAASPESAASHPDVEEVRAEMMDDTNDAFCGVYFISNGQGAIKVGHTTSSLTTRMAQLQAASPYRLYAVAVVNTPSHRIVERQIHRDLREKKMIGEWFALSDDEAIAIAEGRGGAAVRLSRAEKRTKAGC